MKEYLANGSSLGWIINPFRKEVLVYRPEAEPESLLHPDTVAGEVLVTGFVLDLHAIFAD